MGALTTHLTTAALAALLVATASATPTPLARRADMSGCGKTHATGFHAPNDAHSVQSGGQTRQYGIFVPASYNDDPSTPRRVIVDYHGRYGTSAGQYANSRYDASPVGAEYLLVYPQGLGGSDSAWQGASYAQPGVDDLQFTTDLLAHLRTQYCVDSDHVYASGKSNGGGFVDTLACADAGDEFAAFAMASAALYTDNAEASCPKARAILESHGDQDHTIDPAGGDGSGGSYPAIDTWVGWWAQRDGCVASDRVEDTSADGYKYVEYSCGGRDAVVGHYEVYGLGHCWPAATAGSTDDRKDECHDYSLDYTSKVLQWFGTWDLGSAPQN